MLPNDCLATAGEMVSAPNPRQTNLRKAVSAAYYAAFYALCRNTADCFIGASESDRTERAWRQAFRSLDHGFAKRQCRNRQAMASFPPEIRRFASYFVWLQEKRHAADYDPGITLNLDEARNCLDRAAQAVAALAEASLEDRRDFAAWVTLRDRP